MQNSLKVQSHFIINKHKPTQMMVDTGTSIMLAINPMSSLAQGKKTSKTSNSETTKQLCQNRLSDWDIKQLNIGDTHEFKRDVLGRKAQISRYELCKCSDKRVVIRELGCQGKGQIETGYRLP